MEGGNGMKVLALNSSPHKEKGNTALILGPFLEGMKEAGAEVELFYVSDLKVNPCLGDHTCQIKTPGKCIQNDDMKWLLPRILAADVLVFASPLYTDGVTGTLKMLMDRMVPGGSPFVEIRDGRLRHPPQKDAIAKKLVLVSNCGFWEIESFGPVIAHMKAFCDTTGIEFGGAVLRPSGPMLKGMLAKGAPVNDILMAARDAGHQLVRNGTMSDESLKTISRTLLSRDAFLQLANNFAHNALEKAQR
jgi:multimeric flavodoxin WrbA